MSNEEKLALRVIVCGGRDFENRPLLYRTLDDLQREHGVVTIIEGGARGADRLAAQWADNPGEARPVEHVQFKADWDKFGKGAGAVRNQRMLVEGKPDLVIAFAGGRGTADMMARARHAGVEVREIA